MGIDASAVARGTGIQTEYVDRGGAAAKFLPQRLAVFAQAQSGISHPTDKFQVTGGARQVGSIAGYHSPAYAVMRELYPANGGGVGTVPVDLFLLPEATGATPAEGAFSPVAISVAKASTFRAVIAGVKSLGFTVPKIEAVTPVHLTAILESARVAIMNKLGMPVTVAHEYGSPTVSPDGDNVGNGTVGSLAIATDGAPPAGTWLLVAHEDESATITFSLIAPSGFTEAEGLAASGAQSIGGLDFTITAGVTPFEEGDFFTIEVPSTELKVRSGWNGSSANDIRISFEGPADVGLSWAITQPSGGATNPEVAPALTQIGDTWNTMLLNALEISDESALDAFQEWGGNPEDETGRWSPLVRKPAVVFTGNTKVTVDAATQVTNFRKDDNVNCQLPAPGSPQLPCVVAAAQLARIIRKANNNPPHDYGSERVTSITPGKDGEQWDYQQRDAAIKRGSSTIIVKDGVLNIADVVTMYAPTGEEPPAYRHVVDIVKLQNVIYNFDLVFSSADWDGKPLIQNGQPTVNPDARSPDIAKGVAFEIIDRLALSAIITNAKATKAGTTVTFGGPKRLDIDVPPYISGNTNQKDIHLRWSFFLGS